MTTLRLPVEDLSPPEPCPFCGLPKHEGECPPVATIPAPQLNIDDRVAYDGFRRSEWAEEQYRKDHEGWIKLT